MTVDNQQDILDSRDVIARIEELQASVDECSECTLEEAEHEGEALDHEFTPGLDSDDRAELDALLALQEEAESSPDWEHGGGLIRDSYFEEYAQCLADDIGVVDINAGWPNSYIDWEAAADALKQDYIGVVFDGVEYWIRA